MPDLETLNTEGFLFTQVDLDMAVLQGEFGDGYESGVLIGDPQGTRAWTVKVDVLTGDSQGGTIEGSTRAAYLWNFWRVSKAAGNQAFWVELEDQDDGTRKRFLASFADNKLSYQVLCAKLYSTGLVFRQRRLRDVESPVAVV